MKRIIAAVLGILAVPAAVALFYGGDWALLHLMSEPTGQVEVHRYYAIRLKGSKIEYMPLDHVQETCVHSLFPHMGCQPCWYLTRHRIQQIYEGLTGLPAHARLTPEFSIPPGTCDSCSR